MCKLSKRLTNTLGILILVFISLILSTKNSLTNDSNLKIFGLIEEIPILSDLVPNKSDVVEFDSLNGKIITIVFDSRLVSKPKIYSFYENYFKQERWKRINSDHVWEKKIKDIRKKTFKIEFLNNETLQLKIITENL